MSEQTSHQRAPRGADGDRRLLEESGIGYFASDGDGRIVVCNAAFAQLFGFPSAADAAASGIPDLLPSPRSRQRIYRRLRTEGRLDRMELVARRHDGQPLHLVCNLVADRAENGGIVEIRGYVFDDTDRLRAEERLHLVARFEALGQLTGGIAHDFNNLITAMAGYGELALGQTAETDPRRRWLEEILRAAGRAAGLTRQLLAFGRHQVLKPKLVDLNAIETDLADMLRRLLPEDIELSKEQAPDLWSVKADPGQLQQVIVNLVVNARDAMPHGGRLSLKTANVELDRAYAARHDVVKPGRYVMLAVTDSGIGMDADTQARIFDPFFTTKEPGQGTGLGLSTAYGIIKQSGGYIWAYSEPGEGTTFRVYLPEASAHEEAEEEARPPAVTGPGTGTILVVEDDETVRSLVAALLARHGYTVFEAATGPEALDRFQTADPRIDLLVTDVVMPGMRGIEVVREAGTLYPGVKAILMSGYPGQEAVRKGLLERGTPFLEKPFTEQQLLRMVAEVLGGEAEEHQPGLS